MRWKKFFYFLQFLAFALAGRDVPEPLKTLSAVVQQRCRFHDTIIGELLSCSAPRSAYHHALLLHNLLLEVDGNTEHVDVLIGNEEASNKMFFGLLKRAPQKVVVLLMEWVILKTQEKIGLCNTMFGALVRALSNYVKTEITFRQHFIGPIRTFHKTFETHAMDDCIKPAILPKGGPAPALSSAVLKPLAKWTESVLPLLPDGEAGLTSIQATLLNEIRKDITRDQMSSFVSTLPTAGKVRERRVFEEIISKSSYKTMTQLESALAEVQRLDIGNSWRVALFLDVVRTALKKPEPHMHLYYTASSLCFETPPVPSESRAIPLLPDFVRDAELDEARSPDSFVVPAGMFIRNTFLEPLEEKNECFLQKRSCSAPPRLRFSHGLKKRQDDKLVLNEKTPRVTNKKTKLCAHHMWGGCCRTSANCNFAHGLEELKEGAGNTNRRQSRSLLARVANRKEKSH